MEMSPDELTENGYVLLDKLEHKNLISFTATYMKKLTKYSAFYYLTNLILFGLAGYFFVKGYDLPNYDFGARFVNLLYGLAIAFLLVPLHEYIHVLAYKLQGAKKTSYATDLKKFYFMALADKFVASKKEFEIVALSPFIVITVILIILAFVGSSNWSLIITGVLIAHTSMCSGDFGLLSYFELNKEKQVLTYDDIENKISYFYGRIEEKTTT
jgi:hypothetical protein